MLAPVASTVKELGSKILDGLLPAPSLMGMRRHLFILLLLAGCAGPETAPARKPNVVVVFTDDQRWDAMGCAGNPFLKTPNMDRLAREGARFANAFCTTSLCSPSRASMLS